MSLLMDALRKAEESKKKAEGTRESERGEADSIAAAEDSEIAAAGPEQKRSPEIESSEVAAPEPKLEAEVDAQRDSEAELKDSGDFIDFAEQPKLAPASSIPELAVEFEPEEEADFPRQAATPKDVIGKPEQPAIAASELELAPQDLTTSRQPLESGPDTESEDDDWFTTELESQSQPETIQTEAVPEPEPEPQQEPGSKLALTNSPEPASSPEPGGRPAALSIRERTASSRASARSVFAAKQVGGEGRNRRLLLLAGGGLLVAVLLAVGFMLIMNSGSDSDFNLPDNYVAGQQSFDDGGVNSGQVERSMEASPQPDSQAQSSNAPTAANTATETTTTAQALPSPRSSVLSEAVDGNVQIPPAISEAIAAEQDVESAENLQSADAAMPEPAAVETDSTSPSPSIATPTIRAATTTTEAPEEPVALISFRRRESESAITPLLGEAYSAYQAGNLSIARQQYQQVLQESPMHRDAMIGLAAIAVLEGQPGQAMELYSRLLARNPADPVARAGLLDLSPAGSASNQEREYSRLLDLHPDVAPLSYAMGNFYASRQQWRDAQQYYFRALQLAKANAAAGNSVNPDYAYNLAVSLEHLGQARAALSFYEEALVQAATHQAGFDLASARRRVDTLSRTLSP